MSVIDEANKIILKEFGSSFKVKIDEDLAKRIVAGYSGRDPNKVYTSLIGRDGQLTGYSVWSKDGKYEGTASIKDVQGGELPRKLVAELGDLAAGRDPSREYTSLIGQDGSIAGYTAWDRSGTRLGTQSLPGPDGAPGTFTPQQAGGGDPNRYKKFYGLEDGYLPKRWNPQTGRSEDVSPNAAYQGDYAKSIGGKDPIEIQKIQFQLQKAGVLKRFIRGVWDDQCTAAMEYVLGLANQNGSDFDTMVNEIIESPEEGGVNKGMVTRLTDPGDIEKTVQSASARILGRSLRPDELARIQKAYTSLESAKQKEIADAEARAAKGEDVTVTMPPDLTEYAARQLKTQYKGEADYMTGNANLDRFFQLLGGPSMAGGN